MNKNITAEEAGKRIEAGWNKVTNDVGHKTQVEIWRKGIARSSASTSISSDRTASIMSRTRPFRLAPGWLPR